jgi:hypothetical protein
MKQVRDLPRNGGNIPWVDTEGTLEEGKNNGRTYTYSGTGTAG